MSFSSAKKSMPGWMSSSEPPFATEAAKTAANAEPDSRGSPFSATLPLYSGFFRSAQLAGSGATFVFAPSETAPQ